MENDIFSRTEIANGITAIHTGKMEPVNNSRYVHQGYKMSNNGEWEDLGWKFEEKPVTYREVVEYYDAEGNWFYSNCSNSEVAQQLVEELNAEGKSAVIGPQVPPAMYPDGVAVYIVKNFKKSEGMHS